MSLTRKLLLGLAAIWPAIYVICFVGVAIAAVLAPADSFEGYEGYFVGFMVVHFLTMLATIAIVVMFIYDLWRNPAIPAEKRPLWLIFLLLLAVAALPAYWYVHVWNRPQAVTP